MMASLITIYNIIQGCRQGGGERLVLSGKPVVKVFGREETFVSKHDDSLESRENQLLHTMNLSKGLIVCKKKTTLLIRTEHWAVPGSAAVVEPLPCVFIHC
jgi:hypothetical protein